jgi:rhodanese-related sulfurtransferase
MYWRRVLGGVALVVLALTFSLPVHAQKSKRASRARKVSTAKKAAPAKPVAKADAKPEIVEPGEYDPIIARRISVEYLQTRLDAQERVVYLDNRYKPTGPIVKGAQIVGLEQISEWARTVPKDAFIVNYCTCHAETSSVRVVLELQKLGFTNSYALLGGLVAYQAAGLPTEPAPAQ